MDPADHDATTTRGVSIVVDPSRGYRAPRLELAQGVYYLGGGVWRLVSLKSFQAVTGRKREVWLVRTIGLLLSVLGGVFVYSGVRGRRPSEIVLLAIGTSAALGTSSLLGGSKKRRIHYLDAILELGLLASWLLGRGHLPWRPRVSPEIPSRGGSSGGPPKKML